MSQTRVATTQPSKATAQTKELPKPAHGPYSRTGALTGITSGGVLSLPAANHLATYGNQAVLCALKRPAPTCEGAIIQRKCACGCETGMNEECDECSKEQGMVAPLQTAANGVPMPVRQFVSQPTGTASSTSGMSGAPDRVTQALATPGQSLAPNLRQQMEAGFGRDLSSVRIHADDAAAQAAHLLHAKAFTYGKHVVFSRNRYTPGTIEGQRLLAHELTHVLQQAEGLHSATSTSLQQEAEADACAREIAANRCAPGIRAHSQRDFALTPESLNTSIDENASDETIRTELQAIHLWMAGQIETSEQTLHLEEVQKELLAELTRRHKRNAKAAKSSRKTGSKKTSKVSNQTAITAGSADGMPLPRAAISSFESKDLTADEKAEELQRIDEWMAMEDGEKWRREAAKNTRSQLSGQLAREESAPLLENHTLNLASVEGYTLVYTERRALNRFQAIEAIKLQIKLAKLQADHAIFAIDQIYTQRNEMPVRSRISETLGGAADPGYLLDKWSRALDHIRAAQDKLEQGNFIAAADLCNQSMDQSNAAVIGQRAYFGDVISGGGRAVTGLEFVKVGAAATVTIGTGGAAGVVVGGAYSGAQSLAQQASEIHYGLRDKVDWAGIGFDSAMGVVSGYLGGSLGNAVLRRLLANPATASFGAKALSYAVSDYIAGRAGSTIHLTARTVFDIARGQDITWEQFLDQLAAQITDPKQTAYELILGHASRRAIGKKSMTTDKAAAKRSTGPKEIVSDPVILPGPAKPVLTVKGQPFRASSPRPPKLVDPTTNLPVGKAPRRRNGVGLVDEFGRQIGSRSRRRGKPELLGPDKNPISPRKRRGRAKINVVDAPQLYGPNDKLLRPAERQTTTVPVLSGATASSAPLTPGIVLEPGGQQTISGARVRLEKPVISASEWQAGYQLRGLAAERGTITTRYPNATELPKNFKAFDAIEGGTRTPLAVATKRQPGRTGELVEGAKAISIKSVNLSEKGYQTAEGTYENINKYVDAIVAYPKDGYRLAGTNPQTGHQHVIKVMNPAQTVLHIELNQIPSKAQLAGLARVRHKAAENEVHIVIVAPE